jgi:hypothetical protein
MAVLVFLAGVLHGVALTGAIAFSIRGMGF